MLNRLRLFIATPFVVTSFLIGLAFVLSCFFAALIAGKEIDKLNKMQGKQ